MQVNAFGFPLGANIAGGNAAAGAPALGFLQALGVAGAGQTVPVGGPAVLPATSLANAGPTMALTAGAAPGQGFGTSPLLPTVALPTAPSPAANVATPLLPQGNDTLASLTTLPAAPLNPSADVRLADVTAQPSAPDKPILAKLQTTTSLSGLLATATPPVVGAPAAPAADAGATPQLETLTTAQAPIAVELPATDAAPIKGKPGKQAAQDGDAPVAPETAAPQPLIVPAPVAQYVAAQPVVQQAQAEAQPLQAGNRQPRAAGTQPGTGDATGGTTRKAGTGPAQPGDVLPSKPNELAGTDFARAVQASNGDNGAMSQDGGQPHDPQVKFEGALASAAQPSHTAPTTGSTAAAPAVPLAREPVVATQPGQFGHAMGVEIARKVEAGEETLRVRLNPDNLGRVEVTLAFEDGNLKATVRAESQRALDLLRQDMPDLARTLDQAGVRTDAQSFRFEARADTGSGQQQGGQQQRGQNPQQQQHAQADDLEPAPAYRAIRADGQVDLLA
jgi:flagellar hook-length control protein FliK